MWIREKLKALLEIRERPHHVALSFSVGLFIGISPLLGLHTLLGILAAFVFRLNKFVTIMGVYVTNPWTIIPIYTFGTWVGIKLLGTDVAMTDIAWTSLTFSNAMAELSVLLWPFVVGTTVLGATAAAVGYVLLLYALRKRHA